MKKLETTSMKFTGLTFWVQENKLSEKFYKKLGFEVALSDQSYSVVQLYNFTIQLVNIREDQEFVRDTFHGDKGRGMYVYIRVDNVDAEYVRLRKAGLQPATEPRDWEWGNREFLIKDPDGYKLVFYRENTNRYEKS